MKVLITGGAGYIGSHTVVDLAACGFEPIIIDDFRNSHHSTLNRIEQIAGRKISHYDMDCSTAGLDEVILKEAPIGGIIHFAALKAVGESYEKSTEYYSNNLGSTLQILRSMQKFDIQRLVFSSSATVYGEPDIIPVTETHPIKPSLSPYGKTKQMCETIISDFLRSHANTKCIILRYFNPVGAHPSGLIGEWPIGSPNNLVPIVTQTGIGKRQSMTIFGDDYDTPDGTCIRDYIHVCDLAMAHVKALGYLTRTQKSGIFNIGTGAGHSVRQIIKLFEKISKISVNYNIGPRREGDVASIWADNSKAVSELQWTPVYGVEDAIIDAWKWEKNVLRQQ